MKPFHAGTLFRRLNFVADFFSDLLRLLLRGSHGDASWRKFDEASNFFPKEASERSKQTNVPLAHDMKNSIPDNIPVLGFKNKSFADN